MTEKQFTYIKLGDRDEIQDYIIDNNQNNHFKHKEYHFNNISDFEDLFDMLNNLVAKNEQLKEERNYFERKKCEYFNKYNKKHLDDIQLKEENEQLKKEKEFWKSDACSLSNLNSILSNELSIAQEQGYEPSKPYKEYIVSIKTEYDK